MLLKNFIGKKYLSFVTKFSNFIVEKYCKIMQFFIVKKFYCKKIFIFVLRLMDEKIDSSFVFGNYRKKAKNRIENSLSN